MVGHARFSQYWQLSRNVLLWLSSYQGSSWFLICIQCLSRVFTWMLLQWSFKTPAPKSRTNMKPPWKMMRPSLLKSRKPPLKKTLKMSPLNCNLSKESLKKKIVIGSLLLQLSTKGKLLFLKDGAISAVETIATSELQSRTAFLGRQPVPPWNFLIILSLNWCI